MTWKLISKEKPDNERYVLVWQDGEYEIGYYRKSDNNWKNAWGSYLHGLTHWMELPKAPR